MAEPVVEAPTNGVSEENGEAKKPVGEQRVRAKFLISQAAAGSVIGKGGSNISEFQTQSSARIQLSRSDEFFPGTTDRTMLLTGTVNQVLTALHLVLAKIGSEPTVLESMTVRGQFQLRLIVPSQLCGAIIGKGGATIRSFSEDSKANIGVSSQDKVLPGVPERVVRMSGETEHLMRATALVLSKLAENINFNRLSNPAVNYGMHGLTNQLAGLHLPNSQNGNGPRRRGAPSQGDSHDSQLGEDAIELVVPVPENRIGAVIGRGGEVIAQLKSVVGVRIRISGREDFLPGTRDRKVTISGPAESVQIAQVLINQKINQAPGGVQR